MTVQLTAELVESFAGIFLSPNFDKAVPTPPFHREVWELYCSSVTHASAVAPRGHAKSTAFTHAYGLAAMLFRCQNYAVIVSATEDLAIEHLTEMARELRENDELISHFGIKRLLVDSKTDVIVECNDGYQFRLRVKGSGQKMRGMKWNGKRPGLILGDDMEEDEQVENPDRRRKFRNWINRALLPVIRKGGWVRLHGTILHEDAYLSRIQRDESWSTLFYKAHESFDDFSNILWPALWDEELLRAKRQTFINDGDAAGYSQEYLNDPLDNSDAFLKKDDFIPMDEDDFDVSKIICCSADFAVSKADAANRTAFMAVGKDLIDRMHFLDAVAGRWDPAEWVEELFLFAERHDPEIFWVEDGVIWKAVSPMIYREMRRRVAARLMPKYINFVAVPSVKDKGTRGRPLQRRMRAGQTRWNKEAEWYAGCEMEMLRFTGRATATLDDLFDAAALAARGFEEMVTGDDEDDYEAEEVLEHRRRGDALRRDQGRSLVTGY